MAILIVYNVLNTTLGSHLATLGLRFGLGWGGVGYALVALGAVRPVVAVLDEIHLVGDEDNSYSGHIVADVSTGGTTTAVDLPLNGRIDGFDRISPGKFARLVVSPGMKHGIFQCLLFQLSSAQWKNADYDLIDCSSAQVRSILAEIE